MHHNPLIFGKAPYLTAQLVSGYNLCASVLIVFKDNAQGYGLINIKNFNDYVAKTT